MNPNPDPTLVELLLEELGVGKDKVLGVGRHYLHAASIAMVISFFSILVGLTFAFEGDGRFCWSYVVISFAAFILNRIFWQKLWIYKASLIAMVGILVHIFIWMIWGPTNAEVSKMALIIGLDVSLAAWTYVWVVSLVAAKVAGWIAKFGSRTAKALKPDEKKSEAKKESDALIDKEEGEAIALIREIIFWALYVQLILVQVDLAGTFVFTMVFIGLLGVFAYRFRDSGVLAWITAIHIMYMMFWFVGEFLFDQNGLGKCKKAVFVTECRQTYQTNDNNFGEWLSKKLGAGTVILGDWWSELDEEWNELWAPEPPAVTPPVTPTVLPEVVSKPPRKPKKLAQPELEKPAATEEAKGPDSHDCPQNSCPVAGDPDARQKMEAQIKKTNAIFNP